MIKVSYSISKHNNLGKDVEGDYVLWKEVESDHGYGVKGIFKGTRKECQQELKMRRSVERDKNS